MATNTYNCIIINTFTDIYHFLVAGRVLTLTHLAAQDNFEDAHLVVFIVVTLCVCVCVCVLLCFIKPILGNRYGPGVSSRASQGIRTHD